MTRGCSRLLRQFIKLHREFKARKSQSSVLFRAMHDAEKERADAERGLARSNALKNQLRRQVEDARNRLLRFDVLHIFTAEEMEGLVILFGNGRWKKPVRVPRMIDRVVFGRIQNLADIHGITLLPSLRR